MSARRPKMSAGETTGETKQASTARESQSLRACSADLPSYISVSFCVCGLLLPDWNKLVGMFTLGCIRAFWSEPVQSFCSRPLLSGRAGFAEAGCVYIMRGLPGSGKSYWAEQKHKEVVAAGQTARICSADHFFLNARGEYRFDARKLGQAHNASQCAFVDALVAKTQWLFVDNTNTTVWEMALYQKLAAAFGYKCEIVEATCPNSEILEVKMLGCCFSAVVNSNPRWLAGVCSEKPAWRERAGFARHVAAVTLSLPLNAMGRRAHAEYVLVDQVGACVGCDRAAAVPEPGAPGLAGRAQAGKGGVRAHAGRTVPPAAGAHAAATAAAASGGRPGGWRCCGRCGRRCGQHGWRW